MLKEILNRRSVREYQNKEVLDKDILEIIKAGQFAPSANHNQAVEFIIIREQEMKNKLFELVGQEFVKEAPILIVPVTDSNKTTCPVEDLAVVSENIFLEAAALGLGTVWKAVRGEVEDEVKQLLNIPKQFKVINIIPLGYPKEKIISHSDKDFDEKRIHYEKYLY